MKFLPTGADRGREGSQAFDPFSEFWRKSKLEKKGRKYTES
jgi:hypothetical protein